MITYLDNRSLIKLTGKDSENFLQSQLSNDVTNIRDNEIQINAYCQHQGKIIALIWVFKRDEIYYLSFPENLKSLVLAKFNMFKLMSLVEIEDLSESVYQYGLINEESENSFRINDNLSLLTSEKPLIDTYDNYQWEIACVNENLPEIYIETYEKHIPQALNLDINEFGVSFTKGCYPGQEVVARMHYLGKPKRRLFRFTSNVEVLTGDSLDIENSESLKSSGQVIRVAKEDNEFHFLGVFELKHIDDQIFLNNDRNKPVKIINE